MIVTVRSKNSKLKVYAPRLLQCTYNLIYSTLYYMYTALSVQDMNDETVTAALNNADTSPLLRPLVHLTSLPPILRFVLIK